MARAYVRGDLSIEGVHPGNPYDALIHLQNNLRFKVPSPSEAILLARGLGLSHFVPPEPPPQEALPRWRRLLEGFRHSRTRDADAIHHHYDVSNRFYELVLGRSMTYTCACFPSEEATLEEAQAFKYDLVARKLDLKPGMRLLDVGCGWGGMVRHAAREYGVEVIGVTLSREQAAWGQQAVEREGLGHLAEIRFGDYREIAETGFDAVSSIGLTEHIGVRNYPAYFSFLRSRLAEGGRLLNHCITRHDNISRVTTGAFIDRYVFPDGELTGSGRIITAMQDVGLEVRHEENLREHYALTLKGWCDNLEEHWDECVEEVGDRHRQGVGHLHGRVPARLRAQRDPAPPGARREDRPRRHLRLPAPPHLALLTPRGQSPTRICGVSCVKWPLGWAGTAGDTIATCPRPPSPRRSRAASRRSSVVPTPASRP